MYGSRSDLDLNEASDEALLVAFANREAAAGQVLLNRLAPRLFSHAARILGDRHEAEDVVQEAMLRLWRIAPDWQPGEAKVSTWVWRVTVNLCTDRLRQRKRRAHMPLDDAPEPQDGRATEIERLTEAERDAALTRALEALPERQRQAVMLRHLEGLSNPEIAAIMDIGVEAVESLIARGKRALIVRLADRKEELGYDDG